MAPVQKRATDLPAKNVRHLLLITPYFASHGGGVEKVAGRLAEGLIGYGWQVVWLASADRDAAANWQSDESRLAQTGLEMRPVPSRNGVEQRTGVPFPLWGWRAVRLLWQQAAQADVVMIHEALYVPSMLAALVARWHGRPVVLVQHVGAVPYRQAALRAIVAMGNALWARTVHGLAQRIVYISQTVMQYFEGARPRAESVLVPNGVDVEYFAPKEAPIGQEKKSGYRLLFVGRFVEKKGLDIIEALARHRPDLHFSLAGEGPITPGSWNLSNVQVLGYLDARQLARQYKLADALLLPSHGEGFPLVVQEAMASGLVPLVSSETAHALPGVADHVHHAPVARSMVGLIDRWSCLIDSALSEERDGQRAQARAVFAREQWGWARCVAKHDELLRNLLERSK